MIPELKTELDEVYSKQLDKLLIFQHFFKQLTSSLPLAEQHSGLGGDYDDQADDLKWFLYDGYIAHNCLAVRKMIDKDKQSYSLRRVLEKLKGQVSAVTREAFRRHYADGGIPADLADRDYGVITNKQPQLTEAIIEADIGALEKIAEPVKRVVDKAIAHTEKNYANDTTHGQIDQAIDVLKATYNRYALLLGSYLARDDEIAELNSIELPLARVFPNVPIA